MNRRVKQNNLTSDYTNQPTDKYTEPPINIQPINRRRCVAVKERSETIVEIKTLKAAHQIPQATQQTVPENSISQDEPIIKRALTDKDLDELRRLFSLSYKCEIEDITYEKKDPMAHYYMECEIGGKREIYKINYTGKRAEIGQTI